MAHVERLRKEPVPASPGQLLVLGTTAGRVLTYRLSGHTPATTESAWVLRFALPPGVLATDVCVRAQAVWLLKCQALTQKMWIDDTEMEEEGVAEMLLDENAMASAPR